MNLVEALSVFLNSNFVLYTKTHSYHWNVSGPLFHELHKLFEDQYNDLWDNVDTIAEKIRQLDAPVMITPETQQSLSVIDPTVYLMSELEYVSRLYMDHNRMIILLNKVFDIAEEVDNQAVMNYIAERLDWHGKQRWFLKATLDQVA
jgi:starvation-inducible DNA-binding protein